MNRHQFVIAVIAFCVVGAIAADSVSTTKPAFLYSRCFNAEGETRYLPDGTYQQVLQRLRSEFEVRVNRDSSSNADLAGVEVLLIANPSDQAVGNHPAPHHFSAADIAEPLNGNRDQSGALLAVAELGRGRVVAVTDAGWIANDVLADKGIGGVVIASQNN